MGSGATAKWALPYVLGTDAPNLPGDTQAMMNAVDAVMVGFAADNTLLARPAVGKSGRLFTESAASAGLPGVTWREDAAAWRALGSRVTPQNANDIAQIVRAVSGQNVDMAEWQISTGSVRASVSSIGKVSGFAAGYFDNSTNTSLPSLAVTNLGSTTAQALLVKGVSGQSAPIQEWLDSTSTRKAAVHNDGSIDAASLSDLSTTGPSLSLTSSGAIWANRTAIANVILAIRGMSGQSGDLQQWQDSGSTVLSKVDSAGAGRFAQLYDNGNRVYSLSNTPPYPVSSVAGRTGAVTLTYTDVGAIPESAITNLTTDLASLVHKAGGDTVAASASNVIPLSLKAAGGQTADIEEWLSATSIVLARMTAAGLFRVGDASTVGAAGFEPGTNGVAGVVGFYGSNGVRAGSIGGGVNVATTDTGAINYKASAHNFTGLLTATPTGPGNTPLIVQGVAGQTTDIQQWWNSATLVANMSPTGGLVLQGGLTVAGTNMNAANLPGAPGGPVYKYLYWDSSSQVGRIYFGATISSTADSKQDISKIDTSYVDRLLSLEPIKFRYIDEVGADESAPHYFGLTAEAVLQAGLPELVMRDEFGMPVTIYYDRIGAMLIPIVRQLMTRVAALEGR